MMISACTRARLGLLISGLLFAASLGVLVHNAVTPAEREAVAASHPTSSVTPITLALK